MVGTGREKPLVRNRVRGYSLIRPMEFFKGEIQLI
jgi:hypothetical protein